MQQEPFKELFDLGFSSYAVDTRGRVFNTNTDRIEKRHTNQYGTPFVSLTDDTGRRRVLPIARLVASQFIGPDPNHPNFNTVIHKNGDKQDCRVENLAYRSRSYAIRYHQYLKNWETMHYGALRTVEAVEGDGRVRQFANLHEAGVHYGVLPSDVLNSIIKDLPSFIVDGVQFYFKDRI